MNHIHLKPRYGRIVFVAACIVFLAVAIHFVWARPDDAYTSFKTVSSEHKTVGEKQELFQEENEEKLRFLHYPAFSQEQMDKVVKNYIDTLPDELGITFVDYECEEVFDQYISLIFHYQLFDQQQNVKQVNHQYFTFQKESGNIVGLPDILRRDYINMIKTAFKKQANVDVKSIDGISFSIDENVIHLYASQKEVALPFNDIKKYIKLKGKGIASEPIRYQRIFKNSTIYDEKLIDKDTETLSIDPDKPMIAMTFDDGPSNLTEEVMKIFIDHKATASFFMLGQNVENYPNIVKYMAEQGFEMCNHSWDHQSIDTNDKDLITHEVFDTQDAIYGLTGIEPTRMRPPYGAFNNFETKEIVEGNGLGITLWNVDTLDWKSRNSESVKSAVRQHTFDGAIILFHDLYPSTVDAVKELVPELQSQGYQLVSVSDLIKYKGQ